MLLLELCSIISCARKRDEFAINQTFTSSATKISISNHSEMPIIYIGNVHCLINSAVYERVAGKRLLSKVWIMLIILDYRIEMLRSNLCEAYFRVCMWHLVGYYGSYSSIHCICFGNTAGGYKQSLLNYYWTSRVNTIDCNKDRWISTKTMQFALLQRFETQTGTAIVYLSLRTTVFTSPYLTPSYSSVSEVSTSIRSWLLYVASLLDIWRSNERLKTSTFILLEYKSKIQYGEFRIYENKNIQVENFLAITS